MSILSSRRASRSADRSQATGLLNELHLDFPLLAGLLLVSGLGLVVLYSAGHRDIDLILRQLVRLGLAYATLFVCAQISPQQLKRLTPWVFALGVALLIAVLIAGHEGKGAQRWLYIGFRFQPSEIMKISVPMMIAWFLAEKNLPPHFGRLLIAGALIMVPVLLIARQPDLGTSLLVGTAGVFVLFLSGMSWRLIFGLIAMLSAAAPMLWYFFLRDYQRQRILTFLNPENDPLGAGYHIIQSKIALGSGGSYGKGWLNGTQAQLEFLPERSTDFIFAVMGEEFGFHGALLLIAIYLFIIFRGMYIATRAQDTYSRLLAGSLALTFFVYFFVNTGMVTGLLPVVGVPLPLISYGGTSMVTLLAAFGILMSIHTHRRLLPT